MKKIITLLCSIALFCTAQLAHADFKVKNESNYQIKVKLTGKTPQSVNRGDTVVFVTSFNEVTVTGPASLNIKTKVPSNKTLVVEHKFNNWSISFKR
tara:strand:+ start:758 stop:1048 length:291 start_codon:yes stop_codon:yes gene_type:complete